MVFHDRPVYQEEHAAQLIMARRLHSPHKGRIHLRRSVDPPFAFPLQSDGGPYILGNLETARCAGQVSESATTWQIFRKIEYAAGMPQDILSGFSSTCSALSHEQIGRTRAYVITKWRQSEIQQDKETKVPPPRTHGKVGDPVGGQCSAVR